MPSNIIKIQSVDIAVIIIDSLLSKLFIFVSIT